MTSTSTDSAEPRANVSDSVAGTIDEQVARCAALATTQAEFLQQLAAQLTQSFSVALIAIESAQWSAPMMLVSDKSSANQIDQGVIRHLLETAAVVPISAEVSLAVPAPDGNDKTRVLRVELCDAPRRAAILLVYASSVQPTPTEQLHDLRRLSEYAESSRRVITTLPVDQLNRDLSLNGSSSEANARAIQARQSLSMFHRDLDLDSTAYRIANESRRLLNCDRTTILLPKGKRFKVHAISGVSVVDNRSNSVKAIEELATRASVMARPLLLPNEEPLPPQIQEPLDSYLDESGVMTTVMLPLHAPDESDEAVGIEAAKIDPFDGNGDIVGLMFLEYFSGHAPEAIGPTMSLVASEAMLSLRNASEHRKVFGLRLWKSIGRITSSGSFPYFAAASVLLVGLLIASAFIQVEHHVVATGSVQPTVQRQIFAKVDGVVKTIHITDGQQVTKGDRLFELENADIESRAETLAGEILTASKRLASVRAVRLSGTADSSQSSRMALEERQLASEITNLEAQQTLIRTQQDELVVTSPIDGTVVAWQIERRLTDRPVSRGNLLISLVDNTGPWSLRLNVPDHDAGPVLEAFQATNKLPIRFAVATDPESSFAAELQSVATAARMNEAGDHVIDATAAVAVGPRPETSTDVDRPSLASTGGGITFGESDLDDFNASEVRVGADVTARIACGKRSIIRSWFSDVIDFAHRNVFFYFR